MALTWRTYLAAGAAVVAVYLLVPAGVPRGVVYVGLGASSAVAILLGTRRHRPAAPSTWYWMAAGQLCWVVGDALYTWYADVLGTAPFPSAADAAYLIAYGLFAAGLTASARARRRRWDAAGLIDSALVAVALGLLSWVVLAGSIASDGSEPLLGRVIGVAYPAADIVLLAMLVRLLLGPGRRPAAFRMLAAALGLLMAADTTFAVIAAVSDYDGGAVDLLWLASYVLWGTAALHPSMRDLSEPGEDTPPLTNRRLAALSLAVLVAPLTLVVELLLRVPLDAWAVAGCSTVLTVLVIARMNLASHQVSASVRQRDLARQDLAFQAAHDPLTGLANRGRTVDLAEAALRQGRRSGSLVGLVLVALDGFTSVNDTRGQAAGDEVLRVTAGRLSAGARADDTVGRIGGDEFVLLIGTPASESALVAVAERLLEAVSATVPVDGGEVLVRASVGVALARAGGGHPDTLLFEAQAAAARAKASGGNRVEIFDEVLRREHHDRVSLETAIRRGLAHGEFVLHYQPVVDVATRAVRSYEALVRWQRPGHGLVAPAEFIPTAERSSLICDLDRWVLREATRRFADDGPGDRAITVGVNLSGRHIASPEVVADVAGALARSGLPPRRLVLEVTETVMVDQPTAAAQLSALRELGVGIALDDFGTGYTSIGQLQLLGVDALKIDRSLVASSAQGAAELVALVVHAAHAFGLTVVGEGVETEEQVERLAAAGCDLAQGYLFGRPEALATASVASSLAGGS